MGRASMIESKNGQQRHSVMTDRAAQARTRSCDVSQNPPFVCQPQRCTSSGLGISLRHPILSASHVT
eukprot:scaffold285663_cov16-Prasinocladus_malaysianus.AAC.1